MFYKPLVFTRGFFRAIGEIRSISIDLYEN